MDEQPSNTSHVALQELSYMARNLFASANPQLLPDPARPWRLFVCYLRRKPGRGLAVIYHASEIHSRHRRTHASPQTICLTIEEHALTNSTVSEQASNTLPKHSMPDIALEVFPADTNLPTLAACCSTATDSPLLTHLQEAARLQFTNTRWQLLAARATPLRYKPANRCVIRYDLILAHPEEQGQTHALSLFGKVYADPAQARAVYHATQQLYAAQRNEIATGQSSTPFLPQPLLYSESLSLLLSEAVQSNTPDDILRTGSSVLRPQRVHQPGDKIMLPVPPVNELRLAARALAHLHTSKIESGEHDSGNNVGELSLHLRTGSQEVKHARARADLLSGYYPTLAAEIQALTQTLAQRLAASLPAAYRLAHGGFKASQLLYHDDSVSIVDFDGLCLADPALDVGYFLAYLRPSSLWYQRQGARAWFESADDIFTTTYVSTLQTLGIPVEETASIVQRAQLYTAALLYKIATRRVNRLNSPRPHELAAMLTEIASCLALSRRQE